MEKSALRATTRWGFAEVTFEVRVTRYTGINQKDKQGEAITGRKNSMDKTLKCDGQG